MSYKQDTTYKEHLQELLRDVKQLEDKLEEDATTLKEGADEKREEVVTVAKKHREKIQAKYHSLMGYLKDKFDVDQDQIISHRIKQLVHKAHELGIDLQLKTKELLS